MQTVRVEAQNGSYDILIGRGLLAQAEQALSMCEGRRALVVADTNTAPLYGQAMLRALGLAGARASLYTVPAGEESKSLAQLAALYDAFLDAGLSRRDFVVALGGGVVGDLAGYAAASFQRGVRLIQVPTTLLSQVDSSVGGKTAVNLPRGKNLVGAFYQPERVLIDVDTLDTLDARQVGAGLGEVIKYGCIADEALFARIEQAGGRAALWAHIDEVIARCCELKADYVRRDPLDKGVRAQLNFGHTLGHAVENAAGYGQVLHGEGVCMGMVAAARWGEGWGVTEPGTAARIERVLRAYGLPTQAPNLPREALARAMRLDKKASGGRVQVVVLERIGRAATHEVGQDELEDLLPAVGR